MNAKHCLAAVFILFGTVGPGLSADRPQDNPEVQRLEEALKTTANRDSIRFQLALAYRNTGLMEGRLRALGIFDQIRGAYFNDPLYHLEIARTYFEGQRISEARDELARAYRLDPTNVSAYLTSAQLLLRSVLRYSDGDVAKEALSALDHALALDPKNRDALFWKSLYLCLLHDLDP